MSVWDAASGERLYEFFGHTAFLQNVKLSPDGTRVAIAGLDGLVRLFTLDLDELIALAQTRVTRSLTTAEWRQYLHLDECPARE